MFAEHRLLLLSVVLGRVVDAEDVVQDAWLATLGRESATVEWSTHASFSRGCRAGRALDRLRRIKARREDHVGPWLPELLLTGPDVAEEVEAEGSRFESDPTTRRRVTERCLAAATGGDLSVLLGLLAPAVTLIADGGGTVPAPRRRLSGATQSRDSWPPSPPTRRWRATRGSERGSHCRSYAWWSRTWWADPAWW